MDELDSEEKELCEIANDVATSAHIGIFLENDHQQWNHEEADVNHSKPGEKSVGGFKLVVDDFLDRVLFIEGNVGLIILNHQV